MDTTDIGALLRQVNSKEAKAGIVYGLVGKVEIPVLDLELAISYYEKKWTRSAATIAEKAGLSERAIDIYEKKGQFKNAAETANRVGEYQKAKELYDRALSDCLERKDITGAVDIAHTLRSPEKVVEIYAAAGMLLEAARATLPGRIVHMTEDNKEGSISYGGRYGTIIIKDGKRITPKSDLEKLGDELYKRVIENCEAKKDFETAAEIAKEAGLVDRAITNYDKAKMWSHAAEIAKNAGLTELAQGLFNTSIERNRYIKGEVAEYWQWNKGYAVAAKSAERSGQILLAIQIWEENEHYHQALELAKTGGLAEKTKELYLKVIALKERDGKQYKDSFGFVFAAELAKKAGLDKRAKGLYLKAIAQAETRGRPDDAIRYARESGLDDVLLQIYERHKHFSEAATLAKKLGLKDKAEAYEKLQRLLYEYRERDTRRPWDVP